MRSIAVWVRVFLIIHLFFTDLSYGAKRHTNPFLTFDDPSEMLEMTEMSSESKASLIRSNISFSKDRRSFTVHYADISAADPLVGCPLESTPPTLAATLSELVSRLKQSTAKIREIENPECKSLQSRLDATQSQIGDALRYRFIAHGASTNSTQNDVNIQTQEASAVNLMLLTASDMFRRDCILSLSEKVTIQKLMGQAITLSGLLVGGWQGLVAASSGQLLAALPIFRTDSEKALDIIRLHELHSQKGSFLCLYRQMQKVNTLLFMNQNEEVISGFDLSYKTGPARLTEESLVAYQRTFPDLLKGVTFLSEFTDRSESLLSTMLKPDAFTGAVFFTYEQTLKWCRDLRLDPLQMPLLSESLSETVGTLALSCGRVRGFGKMEFVEKEFKRTLKTLYFSISSIRGFYQGLRNGTSELCSRSEEGKSLCEITRTLESKKYFDRLKSSFSDYRYSDAGNQTRVNFDHILEQLGELLGQHSFKQIFEQDWRKLTEYRWYSMFREPVKRNFYNQRVLKAMLELCQTLDPTLASLYIDPKRNSRLQSQWAHSCVGPKSRLCSSIMPDGVPAPFVLQELLGDRNTPHRAYFDSLCGL